jgi:hypothetical protein
VTASGELPTRVGVWMSQQRRWAEGIGEVGRKVLPSLFRHRDVSGAERWSAVALLAEWLGHALFAATIILAAITLLVKPSVALPLGLTVYLLLATTAVTLFIVMRAANVFLRPGTSLWRFLADFIPVPFLTLYITWARLRSLPATMLGRRRAFMRTPKAGAAAKPS